MVNYYPRLKIEFLHNRYTLVFFFDLNIHSLNLAGKTIILWILSSVFNMDIFIKMGNKLI